VTAEWPAFSLGYAGRPIPVHNADGETITQHYKDGKLESEPKSK